MVDTMLTLMAHIEADDEKFWGLVRDAGRHVGEVAAAHYEGARKIDVGDYLSVAEAALRDAFDGYEDLRLWYDDFLPHARTVVRGEYDDEDYDEEEIAFYEKYALRLFAVLGDYAPHPENAYRKMEQKLAEAVTGRSYEECLEWDRFYSHGDGWVYEGDEYEGHQMREAIRAAQANGGVQPKPDFMPPESSSYELREVEVGDVECRRCEFARPCWEHAASATTVKVWVWESYEEWVANCEAMRELGEGFGQNWGWD